MFEGVNEIQQIDVKTLVKQISYDAGVPLQDNDITEAYRIGKTPGRDKRPRRVSLYGKMNVLTTTKEKRGRKSEQ